MSRKRLRPQESISSLRQAGMPVLVFLFLFGLVSAASAQQVFINELHYDNSGTDSGEAIEIAGPAGTDLSGWSIVLYNGNGGGIYNTNNLSGIISDQDNGFGTLTFDYPTNGIQNGAPDGIALVDGASVVQFLSYEGSFVAVGGPANGMLSTDIDVAESSGTAIGQSLQLTGSGNIYSDFAWAVPAADTFGAVNTGQSFGGGQPPPAEPDVVINEIHADPATGLGGDANNDGTRHFGDDEFIEIVNASGGLLDLSGWTLSDGAGLRHEFPVGSVMEDQCSIVVFGGGAPTGPFGGATVQTASTAALGLNNGGDTVTLNDGNADVVTAAYGGEGNNNQSITLDPDVTGGPPYVQHTVAAGSNGTLYSPGTRVDGSAFAGCDEPPPPPLDPIEIFEIQGTGTASPVTGQVVLTQNNVVTVVGPEGFAMQTPASRSDGNVDTSDGVYVFTGAAPTVAVGDLVDVTGNVVEFFDMTEISNNPTVTMVGAGAALPPPVIFDVTTPSPDPASPSCMVEYECYEGMLVQMEGTVTGPNQGFGTDPIAEFHVTAGAERTFRGPGLEFPGMPGLPVWDTNPEVFELDADKLGLPNVLVTPGSTFSATGIIGYEFGGYELWASSLSVDVAPIGGPVRDRAPNEATVGSLNLFRLFDDIDDPDGTNVFGETTGETVVSADEYQRRLTKLARYIGENMKLPDVIGVQEVESLKVLEDLAASINALNPGTNYQAYLEDGNDIGGIDVGFLVRADRVGVSGVLQLGATETYVNPANGLLDILHDRPPLVLDATFGPSSFPMNVMVVHNRSLGSIETERVQVKRFEQAQSIAQMVQDLQDGVDSENVVVVGDFNAFEFSDGYVDSVGHIRGVFDPADSLLSGADLVDPDLMNQVQSLPEAERYSFIFRGNSQVLDHALTTMPLDLLVRGLEYARGNTDAAADLINDDSTPLRASDHDGFVLYIDTPAMMCDIDGDGIIDRSDISSIARMRGTMVPPGNPAADLDNDGVISVLDARGCVRMCTLPRCATP